LTQAQGSRVLLRIEDHDRQRSRAAYEAAILEDLDWLGFRADGPMVRQSERGDIYSQALETLRRQGLVYACGCSRAEIAGAHLARRPESTNDSELWYAGTCRDRGLHEGSGLGVRVRLDPTVERFIDLRHGPQEQQPSEQCGDLLVRDREGNWTYQFAATVDDYVQGVTHVIRGDDLLSSTGRQIQLARLLGRSEPAVFYHHPLIMKSPTQKLSKSDGDTGVRDLRAKGWRADDVIREAMALANVDPDVERLYRPPGA
jgi:glutamyl-tRNA synthetase/glutamyl-Q tRNA(Asp) synthetase